MIQLISVFFVLACLTVIVPTIPKYISQKTGRTIMWVLFEVYVVGNLYFTVFSRVPESGVTVELMPFMSIVRLFSDPVEGGGEVVGFFAWFMKGTTPIAGLILNILLYYPLGYLLPILFPKLKPKHIVLIGCLCSIATEAIQYIFKMGWCETDDVIHNTLGTAIGVLVWHLQSKRLKKFTQ